MKTCCGRGCAPSASGSTPALASVAAGHYYQGRLGQAFFERLRRAGLLPRESGWEDDGSGLIRGLGLGGARVFVMPGPYARRDDVAQKLCELERLTAERG